MRNLAYCVCRMRVVFMFCVMAVVAAGPVWAEDTGDTETKTLLWLDESRALLDQDSGNTSSLADLSGTERPGSHYPDSAVGPLSWKIRADGFYLYDKQYLETIGKYLYRWREHTAQLQAVAQYGKGRKLGIGVLDGEITQYSLIFHDNDFKLQRRGIFVQAETYLGRNLQLQARLRYETFDNNGSGYYRLLKREELFTGFGVLTWDSGLDWVSLSFSRERDPEPVYVADTNRADLNIAAQELSGIIWGHRFDSAWELVTSIYYEAYGSNRPDQWNGNMQLLYRVPRLPQLQLGLGTGYYTQERETVTNLSANFRQVLSSDIALELEYQMEHAVRDNSLLHQGEVLLSVRILDDLVFALQLSAGQEYGEDEDRFVQLNASLQYSF